jgi:hypothetical protein
MLNERIVFTNIDGSVGVLIPTGEVPIDVVMAKDVPAGATNVRQITTAELPQDRLFRGAWDDSNHEEFFGINLVKTQAITHAMRRADREIQFKPYDDIISKQIPNNDYVVAEEARQVIRDEDDQLKQDINLALTVDELKIILSMIKGEK